MIRTISFALAALVVLALPSTASAGVTCDFTGGALAITVTNGDTFATVQRNDSPNTELEVLNTAANPVACNNGPALISTTSKVTFDETTANQGTTMTVNFQNGRLEPGLGADTGTAEIEVDFVADGTGVDNVSIDGDNESAAQDLRFGAVAGPAIDGNLNGDGDADDIHATGIERVIYAPGSGNDTFTADGSGSGTFTGPISAETTVFASNGDDTLTGTTLAFPNSLNGGLHNDTLTGGASNDTLTIAEGNDTADGLGGGGDFASYSQFATATGVTLDLSQSGPQNTGDAGIDQVANLENIVGSNGPDHLTGSSASNTIFGGNDPGDTGDDVLNGLGGGDTLFGRPGNDVLIGGQGGDTLVGELGNDTASYAVDSTGPVTVSLDFALTAIAQPTGGAGSDTLADSTVPSDPDANHEIENLVGSPFGGDMLTGNIVNNVITGYGDGLADTIDCVSAIDMDTAILDELGVETSTNCETVDNAPQTSINSGPSNGDTIADSTPTYGLSADEPSTFQFNVDGGNFSACNASCDVSALTDGTHTLRFRAADADENQNTDPTPVQRMVMIDTVGPTIQIDARPADPTNSSNPSWQFSSAESGVSYECQIDGGAFAPCSSGPAHSAGSLPDGPHTFAVRGRDAVGNAGPTLTDDFTVDRTGPEIQISQRPAEVTNDSTPTWQFSSGEADVTYTCIIDGGDPVPCSGPGAAHTSAALADGIHGLVVFGRDALDNQGATQSDQFRVDTRAPDTEIPGAVRIKTRKKRVSVPFQANEAPATFECSFDGGAFKPCSSPFRTPKMKRGSKHRVQVRATDEAGNADQSPAAVPIKRKR